LASFRKNKPRWSYFSSRAPIPAPGFGDKLIHQPSRAISSGCFLFRLFWPLTIAQSHTWATTTHVDEFDGGQLHGLPDA
jgi:hypothetical protein